MIFTLNIISLSLYIRIKHYFEQTFQSLSRLGVKKQDECGSKLSAIEDV